MILRTYLVFCHELEVSGQVLAWLPRLAAAEVEGQRCVFVQALAMVSLYIRSRRDND